MRKTILISAFALMALASCQTFDKPVTSPNDPINFTLYQGRVVSKANATYSEPIKVTALYKSDQSVFFANQVYTNTTGKYVSDPVYYWPVNASNAAVPVDFYAVSSTTNCFAVNNDKTITVTNLDGAEDLIAASLLNQTKSSTDPNLVFGHKLNKVSFKAIGENTGLKYIISAVTVKANSTSTYTYSPEAWSQATDSKNYSYTLNGTTVTIPAGTTEAQNLGASGYGLMLLPNQPTSAGAVTVSVTYKVVQTIDTVESTVYTGTKSVNISNSTDWGINKYYVYTLKLAAGDAIQFTAELVNWADPTSGNLTL